MLPEKFAFANLSNLEYLEGLYQAYRRDPESIDASWRHFFEGMEFANWLQFTPLEKGEESGDVRIFRLIQAYRRYGHLGADFNPLSEKATPSLLSIENWGFSKEDLAREFPTHGFLSQERAPLSALLEALKSTYCGAVGFEYMDIDSEEMQKWIQKKIEPGFNLPLTAEDKRYIQESLNQAELFENFLHTKYVGQKRFSLEGGETLIPIMAFLLEHCASLGTQEAFIGMAHRGRLNVLANIINKSYAQVFTEFEDYFTPEMVESTGDVKYHKGFAGTRTTRQGHSLHVRLAANPSHLESVDPVVEGMARARQQFIPGKEKHVAVMPILIHGDAALAGQGVIYETLQLSKLNGYSTGGTIHVVINNQIGFTTLPKDARSTGYCTDIAKSFGAPVFHVNAEHPEECVAAARLAVELRHIFGCDVFIDLNCYRKYGHNEGDEPTFTQPQEYALIRQKRPIRTLFREELIREGVLSPEEAEKIEDNFKQDLHRALEEAKNYKPLEVRSTSQKNEERGMFAAVHTAFPLQDLAAIIERISTVPQGFHLHPKIHKLMNERLQAVRSDPQNSLVDWSLGELLSYGATLWEGTHVRISGQDSRRGTFSHRHAVWVDQVNTHRYFPLAHIKEGQGLFDAFNSPLSEYAVLAFEFGYSLMREDALILWEAQYGDFANGAQIIIDQYLAASEQKWGLRSPLVLLLPHGYEGQGPEHSSARMERFLQMSADDNFFVVNCTTPAQLFHLLRRQVKRTVKKPLVLFTPKGIRRPECTSKMGELTQGAFQEILDDPQPVQNSQRILLCNGEIYYELVQERAKRTASAAIVRIEQLYPLHTEKLKEILARYANAKQCIWVQAEHSNMGAWEYIRLQLEEILQGKMPLRYAGRGRTASPAAGSHAVHKKQQQEFMRNAFE